MTTEATSAATMARASAVLPAGASGSWRTVDPLVIQRAHGTHIWDTNGRQYIDHVLAWGSIAVGHCDARINSAVTQSVAICDLTTLGPQLGEVELAEDICASMPCAEQVAFCVSGTEATLHAVQLTRAYTGRSRLLKFHGSYHGWHDMLAVGVRAAPGRESETGLTAPESPGVHAASIADVTVCEWNDIAAVRGALSADPDGYAAVFCEPYVQSYGCVAPAPGFLESLRELCDRYGTLLVFDEVKTGFRLHLGGFQAICGVIPDLATFSKALGNGYAIGGLAGRRDLMAGFKAGAPRGAVMDGTSNASPYAMAAGRETLRILSDGGVERLNALGERMREGLTAAIRDTGVRACVTGTGSVWAVYMREQPPTNYREAIDQDTDRMVAYAHGLRKRGVVEPLIASADRRLCLAATDADVDYTLEAARSALEVLR